MIERYDAGLLNDFGGGDVDWWHDYIRAELERAHDFYESQLAARPIVAEQQGDGVKATKNKVKPLDLSVLLRDAFLAGRGLKDGDRLSEEDQAAWMAYDPERMAAYERIMQALYPGFTH